MARAPNGQRTLLPMVCQNSKCRMVVYRPPHLARTRKYCSLRCRPCGKKKGTKNLVQNSKVAIRCNRCDKPEMVIPSVAAVRKFCSAECADTRFKLGPPRPPTPTKLPFKGVAMPSHQQLYQAVHVRRETRRQTAARYGVCERTIWRWCSQYEIPEVSPVAPMSAEKLRYLYIDLDFSLGAIGTLYNVSAEIIRRLCTQYEIEVKAAGWNRRRFIGRDGHSLRSLYEQRVCNWLSDHSIEHSCEPRLLKTPYHADFLACGFYIEVWGVTGNEIYTARKQRKLALYTENNLPLIDISHSRFGRNTWQEPLAVLLKASTLAA